MKRILFLFAACCLCGQLWAQGSTPKDSLKTNKRLPYVLLFDFMYGMQLPLGNMSENFLYNMNFSGRANLYMPSNWWVAATTDFHFLDNVRTDVVAPLRTPTGFIITENGALSDVVLGQRGFFVGGMAGRLLPFAPKKHRRFGIDVGLGGGYMQHWIRIRLLNNDILPLMGDYKKGYDRMTSGFALQQYVGLRYMGKKKLLNALIGFDFTEGFTQNRRPINFDTGKADTRKRVDVLVGFRVGLSLPIYIHTEGSMDDDPVDFY